MGLIFFMRTTLALYSLNNIRILSVRLVIIPSCSERHLRSRKSFQKPPEMYLPSGGFFLHSRRVDTRVHRPMAENSNSEAAFKAIFRIRLCFHSIRQIFVFILNSAFNLTGSSDEILLQAYKKYSCRSKQKFHVMCTKSSFLRIC